jgi:hypothetical protein
MPQFWKIDAMQWINPEHIIHAEDNPHWDQPTLHVTMATHAGESELFKPYRLELGGEARERVLTYLARDAAADVS